MFYPLDRPQLAAGLKLDPQTGQFSLEAGGMGLHVNMGNKSQEIIKMARIGVG